MIMIYQRILLKSNVSLNFRKNLNFQNKLLKNSFNKNLNEKLNNQLSLNDKNVATIYTNTSPLYKDPESNAEKTVNLLKENLIQIKTETSSATTNISTIPTSTIMLKENQTNPKIDKNKNEELIVKKNVENDQNITPTPLQFETPRLSLWQRIVKELNHYYHGFKLLYFETKIASGLLKKVVKGETLTRRERKQFTRTAADLFRLVPFSLFIIVPFLEFTLPIFLKLFPNMLPSTFKEESSEQEKLKKRLKAKLEMAKFLQDTLEETALKSNTKTENTLNQEFTVFMKKIRTKGEQPSNEEIMKFSSLFENELTLDNLSRQQLIALCQILDVSTLANIPPNDILRFQLRMRMRNLEADDKVIIKEGVDLLNIEELQQACRERGMRAIGLSETRLRYQLEQWLDLHINRKIPLSLLLLSRALYLPENLQPEDLIKTTISVLPKSIENATIAKITEVSGGKLDNQIKLELLKQEQAKIKLENESKEKVKILESPVPSSKPVTIVTDTNTNEIDLSAKQRDKEKLIDKATILSDELVSPIEIKEINKIIENLPINESKQVKAEIEELKKDITEYKEDIKEVEQLTLTENSTTNLTETKSAKILGKRVQKLISDIDNLIAKIDKETPQNDSLSHNNTVSIEELIETIKSLRGISNQIQERKIVEILQSLDKDKDGKIDDINDVLKVFELIAQENVKVSKYQLGKILHLLEKEKLIEMEEEKLKINTDAKQIDKQKI